MTTTVPEVDETLLNQYRETDYIVDDDPPLILKVDEQNDSLRALFASFGVETGAFITAWNPLGKIVPIDDNYDQQALLLSAIESLRLNYFVGQGIHPSGDWQEDSYLVLGIDQPAADELALEFKQLAYIWLPVSGVPQIRLAPNLVS